MSEAIEILMVEDNLGDIELTRETFEHAKLRNNLHIAEDGEKALEFLYRHGDYVSLPRPDLILLDLNLPKLSGREVLSAIKADEDLATIPIIVLSSSEDANDIESIYALNANNFVTKPIDMDAFLQVISGIEDFWVEIVKS